MTKLSFLLQIYHRRRDIRNRKAGKHHHKVTVTRRILFRVRKYGELTTTGKG
jgi:hypothetical protein